MLPDKEKRNKDHSAPGNELTVNCPYCGSKSVLPADPKKVLDKKTIYVCHGCGQTFEHERKNS